MKKRKNKQKRLKTPIYLSFFITVGKLPTRILYLLIHTLFSLFSSIFRFIKTFTDNIRKIHVPRIGIRTPKIHFPKIQVPKRNKISIVLPHIHIPHPIIIFHLPIFPKKQLSFAFHWSKLTTLLFSFFLFVFICSTLIGFFYIYVIKDLPTPKELATRKPIVSTKIYDRNGVLLYTIYKDEKRTLVPLSSIPEYMKHATISIEDKDFYSHKGISLKGIFRAIKTNSESGSIQGGSTITQQLIKNTLLTPEKTIRRKLKEVVLAIQTELMYPKDTILEMYLNEVSYGGSLYGVEEASQAYFGKNVKDITLAEAALLAGLPQSPSVFSPYGSHPEYAIMRQHEVLKRMVEDGYITMEQAEQAKEEHITFNTNRTSITAPHFVMYVREILASMFGESIVSQGGLEVYTTLDSSVQKVSEEAVTNELDKLKKLHVTNGAVLVTNPMSGEIYAMVGSKDYFDINKDGQVNITTMMRQPGSSIKPLTYSVALEKGYTPNTIIDDSPIIYKVPGSEPYAPQNYDGKFHGKVTLRTALASSYNIPAVKTLSTIGVQNVVEKGRQMGITTWDEENAKRFGLSLTLGGGEVTMIDMSKLYGTFANSGVTVGTNPLLYVKNYKGETLYINPCQNAQAPCNGTRTLSPFTAYQITNILKDNEARSPAFGLHSVLNIPNQQVAVKTGTTNSLRDNWTIGYTTNRVVVTWVGNNDNTPMSYVASGITGASPIWRNVMNNLLDAASPHVFATPSGMIKVAICAQTGTLPCHECTSIKEEYYVPGTEPKTSCNPSYFSQNNLDQKQTL